MTSKEIGKAFGEPLPDWYLGVREDRERFTILVERGHGQHPMVAHVVQRLRSRLRGKETLSVQEQDRARALGSNRRSTE